MALFYGRSAAPAICSIKRNYKMAKRIVIALGGNALGKNLEEQMQAVKTTASAIADLIEDGHEVVIAHGNGPQVGMIQNAFAAYHKQQAKSAFRAMPL